MSEPDATISERIDNRGAYVIEVSGEFDLALTDRAEEAVGRAFENDLPVLFDLGDCRFIDSSAIRVFAMAARRAEETDRELVVVADDSQIARVFELTRLDQVVPLVSGLEEAFERLGLAETA